MGIFAVTWAVGDVTPLPRPYLLYIGGELSPQKAPAPGRRIAKLFVGRCVFVQI